NARSGHEQLIFLAKRAVRRVLWKFLAFTFQFFRQFCMGLSREFAESARIDGCGEFRIFWQIYVPLMKPAFGAMTILTTMNAWNDFLWPLVVMKSTENFVIPAGLMSAMTPYGNNYKLLFAGSVMSIVPILIVFVLNQKQFIEGLTVGGVKG
ncbi:carbohydrate ABC transporter permease, partial [Schleiferilactobacillus harbinensis]|uniref:carbohydrate ABC transporter permease n=1 Tax=Schleiferilactobacillus harbinensis TaxID=304207 RepID=UPI0021A28E4B